MKMGMGIVETRDYCPTFRVDHLRPRTPVIQGLAIAPHGNEAVSSYGGRAREGAPALLRDILSVNDH